MRRPARNVKLDVVAAPSTARFIDTLGKRGPSIYVIKLGEALSADKSVRLAKDDGYMRMMLRKAAAVLKVKLVYALDGEYCYVKPIAIDGELKRLILLLREPRAIVELETKKLELHLMDSLARLAKDGIAHRLATGANRDKWVLTEKGMDAL